jgi:hypothetical protein
VSQCVSLLRAEGLIFQRGHGKRWRARSAARVPPGWRRRPSLSCRQPGGRDGRLVQEVEPHGARPGLASHHVHRRRVHAFDETARPVPGRFQLEPNADARPAGHRRVEAQLVDAPVDDRANIPSTCTVRSSSPGSREATRRPCATVPPKGPAAARCGSVWIHWRSLARPAKAETSSWVIGSSSVVPSDRSVADTRSSGHAKYLMSPPDERERWCRTKPRPVVLHRKQLRRTAAGAPLDRPFLVRPAPSPKARLRSSRRLRYACNVNVR